MLAIMRFQKRSLFRAVRCTLFFGKVYERLAFSFCNVHRLRRAAEIVVDKKHDIIRFFHNVFVAFYQYLDARGCKGALHMSCVKCGKTFHMADSNAALFAKHLAQSEQFTLDAADTILYGICSDCKGK